jgi:hypothetical protein
MSHHIHHPHPEGMATGTWNLPFLKNDKVAKGQENTSSELAS